MWSLWLQGNIFIEHREEGIRWQVCMQQVTESSLSHSKALGFKVLYKTNEVEEQLQTRGYCNSPEESQWERQVRNISEDRKDVIRNGREFVLGEPTGSNWLYVHLIDIYLTPTAFQAWRKYINNTSMNKSGQKNSAFIKLMYLQRTKRRDKRG